MNRLTGQTVLITGASGLLGRALLAGLVGVDAHIIALGHTAPVEPIRGVKMWRGNYDLSEGRVHLHADYIIHAAGPAQPAVFMADPFRTLAVNTAGTLALLRCLTPGGRLLFCSSNAVYAGRDGPTTEDDIGTSTPADPRACYIEGKRGGEALVHAARAQGLGAVAVRLGDVYGPGTRRDDQRALNTFIRAALCDGRIDLRDDGAAVRTYLYVADAAALLWRILLDGRAPVYNVCGREAVTVAQVAATIGRLCGVPVTFPAQQRPVPGAPAALWRDTTRLDTEFGSREYVALEDGLRMTIDWQRAHLYPEAGR